MNLTPGPFRALIHVHAARAGKGRRDEREVSAQRQAIAERLIRAALHAQLLGPHAGDLLEKPNHIVTLVDESRLASAHPRPGSIRVESNDMLFLGSALKQGLGIGFLPTFMAQSAVLAGELLRIIPSVEHQLYTLYFLHPYRGHVPRRVTAFREFIIQYLSTSER